MSTISYSKLKRINWVTETDKTEPDNQYMTPEQSRGMDHYQQISQSSLKSIIWIIK